MIMKEGSGEPVWSELTRSFKIDFFVLSIAKNVFQKSLFHVVNMICFKIGSKLMGVHWFGSKQKLVIHTSANRRPTRKRQSLPE